MVTSYVEGNCCDFTKKKSIFTLLSFSPSWCGKRVLRLWKPALMLCMRRLSLELAISRRTLRSLSTSPPPGPFKSLQSRITYDHQLIAVFIHWHLILIFLHFSSEYCGKWQWECQIQLIFYILTDFRVEIIEFLTVFIQYTCDFKTFAKPWNSKFSLKLSIKQ